MNKIHFFIVLIYTFSANLAFANFKCQIVTQHPFHLEEVLWDGEPTVFSFPFKDEQAHWRIQKIGLEGHPEYLFDLKFKKRILMDMSQAAYLKDYVFSWRSSDSNNKDLISIACRLSHSS